jgi:hypothetical protein
MVLLEVLTELLMLVVLEVVTAPKLEPYPTAQCLNRALARPMMNSDYKRPPNFHLLRTQYTLLANPNAGQLSPHLVDCNDKNENNLPDPAPPPTTSHLANATNSD